MATVNKRVGLPQAMVINGVDAGGNMVARIQEGFDNVMRSSPDGLQVPVKDKEIEYVRGEVVTQDWVEAVNLLIGVVGTYVFYERKSGVAAATGYIKHTLTNPVIHSFNITVAKGGYAGLRFSFECKAVDETEGIAAMHTVEDAQAAPAYIAAARGAFRVKTATHSSGGTLITIYHVTAFSFSITLPLARACNDGDVGYTCVDARLDGMSCEGSITFQDSTIAAGAVTAQKLLVAAADALVLTVTQSGGAADKVITIANADFNSIGGDSGADKVFTDYTANFDVANDAGTPLTLEGDNKIITIA